jgi:predicted Zn-dependent protease
MTEIDVGAAQRLAQLTRVLDDAPGDLAARADRAELRLDSGDPQGAESDFADILRHDDGHLAARHGEIRALLAQQRDAEALARLDVVLRRNPDDSFGLRERAQLAMRYHHVAEALADIARLMHGAADGEALVFAADQLLFVGRARDAVAAIRRAPESAEAQLVLGRALLEAGETDAAVAALEAVLALALAREPEVRQRLAGTRVSVLKLLGDAHARRGEAARALDRYVEAMGVVGSSYELRRAVVKLAWSRLAVAEPPPAPVTTHDAAFEARWIEPGMTAQFVDGKPVEIASAELARPPYLERLPWTTTVERLVVSCGSGDDRDALTVLFQLALPRLRVLEITAEQFGFACLFRLVEAPFFARLESLTLRGCDLDAPALQLLVERAPRGLRELRVWTADARPKLPRATTLAGLLRRWDLPSLHTLALVDCQLGADEVLAITQARLPSLTTLALAGNDLRALDVPGFLASALVRGLRELGLADTGIEPLP